MCHSTSRRIGGPGRPRPGSGTAPVWILYTLYHLLTTIYYLLSTIYYILYTIYWVHPDDFQQTHPCNCIEQQIEKHEARSRANQDPRGWLEGSFLSRLVKYAVPGSPINSGLRVCPSSDLSCSTAPRQTFPVSWCRLASFLSMRPDFRILSALAACSQSLGLENRWSL